MKILQLIRAISRRYLARALALCIVGVGSVMLAGCSVLELKGKELIGQPAPEARLMYLDGSEIPLSAQKGRNTAILFWATWCTHSRTIIGRYEELAERYGRRGDIDFFAISVDKNDDFEKLKARIEEQQLKKLIHFFSGNEGLDDAFVKLQGESVPYVVFIDPLGVVRFVDSDLAPFEEYLQGTFAW